MTFNGLSWGYVDSTQAAPYSYNVQQIIHIVNKVTCGGGNLLLNIGPMLDGSVPPETIDPLTRLGKWLSENGRAVYGNKPKSDYMNFNGVCGSSFDGPRIYVWNWIWPKDGRLTLGGFMTPLKSVRLLKDGSSIAFEQRGHRIVLKDLPQISPDLHVGIAVFELEFEQVPEFHWLSYYPQLHGGVDYAGDQKI
jgi:alpha-L-fucosidase